ncbi:MAG: hypothetical protein FJY10_00735 [Bacteroidetes bacterium]|nr:hypothetical protein [Bacteroidota bacterium]
MFSDGYYLDDETVKKEIRNKGMFNVIDHRTGLKIAFIVRKDTEYRQLEFSRRIRKNIDEVPFWIVSAEDLIISKIGWIQQLQSERQMEDIRLLLSLQDIDKAYILYWCSKLNYKTFDLI